MASCRVVRPRNVQKRAMNVPPSTPSSNDMRKYPDSRFVKPDVFRVVLWLLLIAMFCTTSALPLHAQGRSRLTLKTGLTFDGKFSSIDKLSKNLAVRNVVAGGVQVRNIVIIDDELRRTFFPKRNLVPPIRAAEQDFVVPIFKKRKKVHKSIGFLGAVRGAEPFDQFGRRKISVRTASGWRSVVQEIVEISPVYTRLQSREVTWDMRIATSNIPSADLRNILISRAKPQEKIEARFNLVRILYLSDRFLEAANELDAILKDHPDIDQQQKDDLKRQRELLVQQYAQLLLKEIGMRKSAGQHTYASFLLRGLLKEDSKVGATENRIEAGEMLAEYDKAIGQGKEVLELLKPMVSKKNGNLPREKMVRDLFTEIKSDLNINNLDRMADFLRLAKGGNLTDDEKLAIGISGWLLGQGQMVKPNLDVASNLLEVRNLVREYLRAMGTDAATKATREELLAKIRQSEGGAPTYVAQLLKNMKPPLDMPEPTDVVNQFTVSVPNTPEGFPVEYTVQLPPEYDPYTNYPTIVALHMAGSAPQAQINWWAGKYDEKTGKRAGQASRHGYIVVAPKWSAASQTKYEYSAKEHNVVLTALRDATRRFSIDSDRVFISGHALGGDAAWDIAVSHPDLWAGMVLIGAKSDYGKDSPLYTTFYEKNPKNFPMYFVFGELDNGKMADNASVLNDYFDPKYDTVVVQYKGRGNEHFFEEILRIFEWMNLQQRSMPTEFEVDSMRPWDNFFWFTEFEKFPTRTMVSPFEWPKTKPSSSQIEAKVGKNRVNVRSGGATRTTVWLSPEFIDFDERMEISVNGKKVRDDFQPDLEIMLEDARTRSDRQHVFWSKVEVRSGR